MVLLLHYITNYNFLYTVQLQNMFKYHEYSEAGVVAANAFNAILGAFVIIFGCACRPPRESIGIVSRTLKMDFYHPSIFGLPLTSFSVFLKRTMLSIFYYSPHKTADRKYNSAHIVIT